MRILQMSRVMLAIHFMVSSAAVSFAAEGTNPFLIKRALLDSAPLRKTGATQTRIQARYAHLPLYFEANRGQTDSSVKFMARGAGFGLYLASSEATLVSQGRVIHLRLKGSNAHTPLIGRDLQPSESNYFLGNNPHNWLTHVARYSKVEYSGVYPGIDMIYQGDPRNLEYVFHVAAGANPNAIRMSFDGARRLSLDTQGNLVLSFKKGADLVFKSPTLYQDIGNERVPVSGRFVLAGKHLVSFQIGDYIRSQPLVIDPTLVYSTYLGGTVADRAFAIAVDSSGNAYITGATASNLFPGAAGKFQAANGGGASDVFVTKVNAAGTAVVWSTYLGGAGDDQGNGIAVDGLGNVYVTGSTTAGGFPTVTPFQAANGGGTDAFVTAVNPTGTALIYSTYLGGAGEESGTGIAVSPAGIAYVAGHTTSAAFPVSVGVFQAVIGGADDAFVASFSAAGGRRYASFLGGTGSDHANAIAIDNLGDAYVTGQAADAFPIFPLAPPSSAAFKLTITGSFDAFISKVDPTGANLLYSTYVGGSGIDEGTAIALDSSNNAYITGFTFSANFPKIGFATIGQTTIGTAPDAYVFKLRIGNGGGSSDGVYSTYLGASTDDRGMGIAVDAAGDAYVSGQTTSGDFPTVNPLPGQTVLGATGKAFVTEIGPTGGTKVFSTYLGGVTNQAGQGIALDSSNNIYVAGWTNSTDFPTVIPIQAANAGAFDAFLSKISAPTPASGGSNVTTGFSINPKSGPDTGSTTVVITGLGLTGATSVTFAGVNAASFTVDSNTQITARSPAHGAGAPVDVIVALASGGSAVAGNFTYFDTGTPATGYGINPITGPTVGDTEVLIHGTGFTGAPNVSFDGVNVPSFIIDSDSQIRARSPAHAAGPPSIAVAVTQLSGVTFAGRFTYFDTRTPSSSGAGSYIFPSPADQPTASIAYTMAEAGTAQIRVYNEIGDLVTKLEDAKAAGVQVSTFRTAWLAPGVYYYLLNLKYNSGNSDERKLKKFVVKH